MLNPTQNNLDKALEQLDLKGLLVLNGLITQRALEVILAAEAVQSKLKPSLLIPEKK